VLIALWTASAVEEQNAAVLTLEDERLPERAVAQPIESARA